MLVEVLSAGTERYDRGEKSEHYKQIPSFEECVLVSQKKVCVEVWRREGDSWHRREAGPGESITLESIGCSLDVDDIYRGVLDE